MNTSNPSVVVGVFEDQVHAQDAVRVLRRAGFEEHQIGVVLRSAEKVVDTTEQDTKVAEGLAVGASVGATGGALWAVGIAAGLLPAIGPVIAGGLLAAVLASAASGAAVAGVLGGLLSLGVPEEEALHLETDFNAGRTLVTVRAPGRAFEAESIMKECGALERSYATTHSEFQ